MMNKKKLTRVLLTLGLLGTLAVGAQAGYVENENVQKMNGDASPTAAASNVNNYINQDEQLNVSPTDGVVKVLRTDQKIGVNDYVTAIIPVHHATPREISSVMRQVTGIEGGRAESINDKNGGNAIQVIAPRYMIPYLRDSIAALDVDWIKEYWDGASDAYFKMQHRKAADVDAIATFFAGTEGFTTVDTTNNSLRRFDEEYRIKKYDEAIKQVDIPANQVELDVTIYEVNANNDTKIGLDYIAWKNGPGRNLFNFIEAGYSAEQRARGYTSVYDPFIDARVLVPTDDKFKVLDTAAAESYRAVNYLLTSNYVDFLQTKGKARVLNTEHLLVASANTGTISAEEQVMSFVNNTNELDQVPDNVDPVSIVRNNSGGFFIDANGNGEYDEGEVVLAAPGTVTTPDSKRRVSYHQVGTVGTRMTVRPFVGLGSMELEIAMEQNELNGVAPSGLPIINTRQVNTTVRLLDGQPYVVAGLKTLHNSKNTARAPFLGGIPGVGYLFGGETNLKRENELVVVITPHFKLATAATVAKAPRIDMMEKIVAEKAPLPLPQSPLAYDQWLLGNRTASAPAEAAAPAPAPEPAAVPAPAAKSEPAPAVPAQ